MLDITYVRLESLRSNRDDFYGSIKRIPFGHVDLSIVQSTSPLVRRTASLAKQSHEECLLVHCAHTGRAQVQQQGRLAELAPGDITTYLSTEPYDLKFQGWFDTRVIKIPANTIKPYVRNLEDLTATTISGSSLEGTMLRSMVSNLCNGRTSECNPTDSLLTDALIQVVRAALQSLSMTQGRATSNLNSYYTSRAKAYIVKNLRSETLGVDEVASALGISSRHLSRVFDADHLSVANYILTERLEACGRELARLSSANKNIGSLAFSWGFINTSHFCKVFKAHFGATPTEWHRAQGRNRAKPTQY